MSGPCPTNEKLLAFHLGTLPDDEVEALAAHLETCPRCETVVQAHEADADAVLAALRRPAGKRPRWAEMSVYQAFNVTGQRSERDPDPVLPANWPDLPGYEILAYLGRGGMGTVYKARNLRLGRLVALKRLRSDDERFLKRSQIEAETLARLQHPNIVQLYEMAEHDGRLYLALELIEGEPLAAQLQAKPHGPRPT
ncbi:MAG TPA: protein kinase, partial [Gemmataceae bacterium]|nr:protein kinase [Gemmataceae bacterium]